ncbi:MAG: hypothetical protein KatS3mg101_0411 [Patescibacteria group bacterium]|nr:MAG: hypothetical protein KatS3mg101_0411 [Patescibacteria group bacterium]
MNEESIEKQIKSIKLGAFKDAILDFVFPLIGLLITVSLFFFYIKPTYKKINDMKAELVSKSAILEVLNTKASALTKMKDYDAVLKEDAEMVERLYASESNVPQLLDEVHQIATNAGMTVDRLNYSYSGSGATTETNPDATSTQRKEDVSGIVNVTMSITGTYDQMIVFMQEIERAARIAYVTTFRFGATSDENDGSLINVNVNVDSPYMYVQSVAVTDDPITLDVTSPSFISFINSIKDYKYYEFLNSEVKVEDVAPSEETPFEGAVEAPSAEPTPSEETSFNF